MAATRAGSNGHAMQPCPCTSNSLPSRSSSKSRSTWFWALALTLLRDLDDARDAAQEAYATAWLRLRQLRDPSAFATWVKTIVARNCARRLRQRTRRAEAVELPRMVGPDTHGVDYQSLITSALATLPEGERDVTVLFYFLGQTEIGRVLHLEPGTVAKR